MRDTHLKIQSHGSLTTLPDVKYKDLRPTFHGLSLAHVVRAIWRELLPLTEQMLAKRRREES
jgi:hypothetical protein